MKAKVGKEDTGAAQQSNQNQMLTPLIVFGDRLAQLGNTLLNIIFWDQYINSVFHCSLLTVSHY